MATRTKKATRAKRERLPSEDNGSVSSKPKLTAGAITPFRSQAISFTLEGLTPLICNRMSSVSIDDIQEKRGLGGSQKGRAKKHDAQNIFSEVIAKLHIIGPTPKGVKKFVSNEEFLDDPDGCLASALKGAQFGVPAAALKKAIADIGWIMFSLPKKTTNGAVQIVAEEHGNLIPINVEGPPTYRRGNKQRPFLLFYQPVFLLPWSIDLLVEHDLDLMESNDVLALFDHAGRKIGIGNNRVEKGGENGAFKCGTSTMAFDFEN